MANVAFAALPAAPTNANVTATSTDSITISWSSGMGSETYFTVEESTDGVNFTNSSSSIPVSTFSYQFTGLSLNTQYTFRVASVNAGHTVTSSYATAPAVYTLAATPDSPSIITLTTSTLWITIEDSSGNPAATTYAIWNGTDSKFIDHTTGANGDVADYQTISTWGSDFTTTGLTPNTSYIFRVKAKNGDGIATETSTASTATYTYPETLDPTISTSTVTTTSIPFAINTGNNPASTLYAVAIYATTTASPSGNPDYVISTTTGALVGITVASIEGIANYYQVSSSWEGISVSGLLPNTGYSIIIAVPGDGEDGSGNAILISNSSAIIYTLASTPSISATANSATQITLEWSGNDASTYDMTSSDGNNLTGTALTSKIFTGLGCGTVYSFSVIGYNGDSVATASASTTATTAACASSGGGGGGYFAPSLPASSANNSAVAANSIVSGSSVNLNLNAPGATSVAISEDTNFVGAAWVDYGSFKSFNLSAG